MRWQALKREAAAMRAVLEREPYDEARTEFDREYVRRLRARHGGELQAMSERLGLAPVALAAALAGTESLPR